MHKQTRNNFYTMMAIYWTFEGRPPSQGHSTERIGIVTHLRNGWHQGPFKTRNFYPLRKARDTLSFSDRPPSEHGCTLIEIVAK